jgi:hypothetical protein
MNADAEPDLITLVMRICQTGYTVLFYQDVGGSFRAIVRNPMMGGKDCPGSVAGLHDALARFPGNEHGLTRALEMVTK